MGSAGEPVLRGIGHVQRLVFRVLSMIMWAAPVGAFGAIAAVVGATGVDALKSLAVLMLGFYITCALFVFVRARHCCSSSPPGSTSSRCCSYLGREFLLIVSTSSSESALPRLIAKMEHAGVDKPTVGVVVPTGYSFNLDGTAIYLTMASLFIAEAMGDPLSIGEQISLLLFMMIASKGAAGVTGAGMATLAGGLSSHRPELVDGVGLIVGIDRFMSEARAVTNFAGNAVATVLVGHWTGGLDRAQARPGAEPAPTRSTRPRCSTTTATGPPDRAGARARPLSVDPDAGPARARVPGSGVRVATVRRMTADHSGTAAAGAQRDHDATDADPARRRVGAVGPVGATAPLVASPVVAADRHHGRLLPAVPGDRPGGRGRLLRGALGAAADLRARRRGRLRVGPVHRRPAGRGAAVRSSTCSRRSSPTPRSTR